MIYKDKEELQNKCAKVLEPVEYVCAVTAAAIKTGYRGPIFLQKDHFQINAKKLSADAAKEIQTVKILIWEAIEAGFYNINIDTSLT
jgi:hypothetical protein